MEPSQNTQWWKADDDESARRAISMITAINTSQVAWHADNLRHTRMYENRDYFGTAVASHMVRTYSQARRMSHTQKTTRMALNITKSCIDTLTSKIAKEKVRPVYLTTGGMIERRERCDKLNQWLYGQFDSAGVYEWNKQVFRNGCIYGKGASKTFITKVNGKPVIKSENVFTPELLVDPYDAYYGNPLCLYQQKFVTKDSLRSDPILGKNSRAIDMATGLSSLAGATAHDTTICWEAWRRKSDREMGRHLIFTDAGVLFQEDWDDDQFPIDFFDYTRPVIGFWGVGIAEELIPIQIELNRVSNHIRDCMILGANPRTYVPIGAQIDKNHFTNRIGGIVPFAGGQPPIQATPPSVNRESLERENTLFNRGFEIVGLNLMSASGRNTLGASASGEAIRSYNDIETERYAETQQNWEDYHVRLANRYHRTARQIVKDYKHYIVSTATDDRGVGSIDFADIDIPEDAMTIQRFPQNALPQQPGFRFATIKEYKDEGYIDQDDARDLMDIPDIKQKTRYVLAPRRVIEKLVEKMAYQPTPKDGRWLSVIPEPYMDVTYALIFGTRMYNFLLLELPEDDEAQKKAKMQRLNLVRQWIDKVNQMSQMSQKPPPPMDPMAGGGTPTMQGLPPMGGGGAMGMPPLPPMAGVPA